MIKCLCWLNIIETLVSQLLFDMEISHEEFVVILKEKGKCEKMKKKNNIRNMSKKLEEKAKKMKLNSVSSRT